MNFSGNTDIFFHWPEQQLELPLVTCCKANSCSKFILRQKVGTDRTIYWYMNIQGRMNIVSVGKSALIRCTVMWCSSWNGHTGIYHNVHFYSLISLCEYCITMDTAPYIYYR